MFVARTARVVLPFLLSLTAANAEELRIVGRHALQGRIGGQDFGGHLEIAADATYSGERRYANGAIEPLAGRVVIDVEQLVLRPGAGAVSAISGGAAAERRYSREGKKGRPVWKLEANGDVERLIQEKKPEPEWWHLVKRATVEGNALNWLLNDNQGKVDESPLILRSKIPQPCDIERYHSRYGLKTVLSLNGDQDQDVRDAMRARGIEHVVVRMSADEAPTDAELVEVFSVMLDDSKKPLLIHCKGGSDRTGIISALYAFEFQGKTKKQAKRCMRRHLWAATSGTEIQGAYLDLYQKGRIRDLLVASGYAIPLRYR